MKKKLFAAILALGMALSMSGCQQGMTKNFGGSMTLELEPNQKLEMITWKDDSLWYLTRTMILQRLTLFSSLPSSGCLKEP